jgi:spore maturation protein CgeB
MRILVGLGIVLALVIAFVLLIGTWGPDGPPTQALSLSVGNRTVTVAGHYKSMTQETIADGIKVIVDGHEVVVAEDQLTVDGKVQVLEPDQDVMVYVAEDGKVSVKIVHEDEAAGQEPSEEAPE